MQFRSSALAILGALAILAASSTGAHGHADRGAALDKSCAVCTAQAQNAATTAGPQDLLPATRQLILEMLSPAPLARDLRTRSSAAPRGPPPTA